MCFQYIFVIHLCLWFHVLCHMIEDYIIPVLLVHHIAQQESAMVEYRPRLEMTHAKRL